MAWSPPESGMRLIRSTTRPTPWRRCGGGCGRGRALADGAVAFAPAVRLARALSERHGRARVHADHRLAVLSALRPTARGGRRLGRRLREGMDRDPPGLKVY